MQEFIELFWKKYQPKTAANSRLYSNYITSLKVIQSLGYVFVILSCVGLLLQGLSTGPLYLFIMLLIPMVIVGAIGCSLVYMSTEGFIAIIDLLSRIEENTRKLREQKNTAISATPKAPPPPPVPPRPSVKK